MQHIEANQSTLSKSGADRIILDGNLNQNIIKVLSELCITLQKRFDISPNLINTFINSPKFIQVCNKTNERYFQLLQEQFRKIEEIAVLETKSQSEEKDSQEFNLKRGWEGEKCGYLLKEYPNGYKKYCNQHKYLHGETIDTHDFVFKTQEQIIEEKTFTTKLDYYQEYLNKLLESVQDAMTQYIRSHYTAIRIKVDAVMGLNDWLKDKTDCFKTRFILSLVDERSAIDQKSKQKYNFGNYIDIYLPNEMLEKYLNEITGIGTEYIL